MDPRICISRAHLWGKGQFPRNFEQIDSKCPVNNVGLAVNKEADRFKSRPSFPRKSLFNGRAKRSMGKVIFYATIDRRTLPILRRHILTLRNISSGLVIKASSLLLCRHIINNASSFPESRLKVEFIYKCIKGNKILNFWHF